jgi:HCOMODA/2-hydroxy-3-carboxy-muconic semialdehyde decarboxylase
MKFRLGLVFAMALLCGLPKMTYAAAMPDTDEQRIADLVSANRILADQGVLDGFGHISVRSVKNPKHFFMSRSLAPAMVTKADIMEFDENSAPIDQKGRDIASERFIHGEIYRARPDVQSVVHSHSHEVLPFTITDTPFRPVIHTAYFLGFDPVPVFDIRNVEGANNKMLVNTMPTAAALAKVLGTRSVALMRGHGLVVTADTIPWATFRAIYTQENAEVLLDALKLGKVNYLNQYEVNRADRVERHWDLWKAQAAQRGLK